MANQKYEPMNYERYIPVVSSKGSLKFLQLEALHKGNVDRNYLNNPMKY